VKKPVTVKSRPVTTPTNEQINSGKPLWLRPGSAKISVPSIAGLCSYAVAAAGAGDIEVGTALLNDFVDAIRRSGRAGLVEELLVGTAVIAHMTGDQPSGARLLTWVRSRTSDRGLALPTPAGYALYRHYVPRVRAALTRDEARRYVEEGRAMSENDALECARRVLAPDDPVPAPHEATSPHRSD
jgi:hypothetical protein